METIQQIVERIPRAFELAAGAMNVTPSHLRRLIEAGEVDSTSFLNAVSAGLELHGRQDPNSEPE